MTRMEIALGLLIFAAVGCLLMAAVILVGKAQETGSTTYTLKMDDRNATPQ